MQKKVVLQVVIHESRGVGQVSCDADKKTLQNLDLFHCMEVLFPEYFQSTSRIFPCHGKHFHTMEVIQFFPVKITRTLVRMDK